MIPPSLDFASVLFDPLKALHSDEVPLPFPKAKTYNNIAEYYSHTILKKKLSNESKKQIKPRERNYQWYYDTLGLSESQRNYIQATKKIKRRKGKKPVPVVTIPGSPLKSEKVTVCKSEFKDYCRRKYRSLTTSAIMNIKSKEFDAFPTKSNSKSSSMSSLLAENLVFTSASSSTKHEKEESNSVDIVSSSALFPPPASITTSHIMKTEVPATLCVVKTESCDSSDECCPDDILISNMKSNVLKGYTLKSVYESPSSIQIKKEPIFLSSKIGYNRMHSKSMNNSHQSTNKEKLFGSTKPGHLNLSLNSNSNMKSGSALNNSVIASSKVKSSSKSSVKSKKKGSKKHKNCNDPESKLQADSGTGKLKKKKRRNINNDTCDASQKSTENNSHLKESAASKENSSSNDSKSNIKAAKKRKKSALKSKENMLNCKKIETDNSPVDYHCTCNFPCGLTHLCTCGYYANAKEALSKFKIPRKKK